MKERIVYDTEHSNNRPHIQARYMHPDQQAGKSWEEISKLLSERVAKIAPYFTYRGRKTYAISFPLGGIGSGSIGLAGNGQLIDWEIFNRPNKGSLNGFTFFAIKAESNGEVLDARVLVSDHHPPYTGDGRVFGFGLRREHLSGLPHFKDSEFEGMYPIAKIYFIDESFPGNVRITAFNPFIPLEVDDSSLPAAFFEIEVENTKDYPIEYTICLTAQNPSPPGRTVNEYREIKGVKVLLLHPQGVDENSPEYGMLAIATDAVETSYQEYWFRGSWFDDLQVFWKDFTAVGGLQNRRYPGPQVGVRDHASIAARLKVEPKQVAKVRFLIAWFYPNCRNYWNPEFDKPKTWRNYYAVLFPSIVEVVTYCFENWEHLYSETREFRNCLFASTLPVHVIDAVSANLSILKSPTVMRLDDGSLYGFEGCGVDAGCCEGSCAHVWRYAVAQIHLFPRLDRTMWDLHLRYGVQSNGKMNFRLMLPLGREWPFPHAAVDGQYGCLLRAYAFWKFTGEKEWLKEHWNQLKRMIEYAWSDANDDAWDRDRDGVLEGRQHNTFDVELFGPNAWLTGFYLAALKVAAEIAEHLDDGEAAREYVQLLRKGKAWVENNLFNGEYFIQMVNLKDRGVLETYIKSDPDVLKGYWDEEHSEVKYQLGEGCFISQVEAQFYANLFGLGEVFDRNKVRAALNSIYRYNFKSARGHFNPCRIYMLNDEKGVLNCSWPKGKVKPTIPIPYAEEVWSGIEYLVAAHMVQEGLIEEALEIVKAVRERYDGEKRNPWNEIECGSNYSRSLSSYALLIALSGFDFDARSKSLSLNPKIWVNGEFASFWCTSTAWGMLHASQEECTIAVRHGNLELRAIRLPFLDGKASRKVVVGDNPLEFEVKDGELIFTCTVVVREGATLRISSR
ncbi:MAG: GH116 family glycosyl-hydrolase [Thermofilaceae archaeon]